MGIIIDHEDNFRLPEGWKVETRSSSAVIVCPGVVTYQDGHIEIDYDDIPKLRAALDVIDEQEQQR